MIHIPFDSLLAFFAASLLLALAPGPDNLFVLAQSAVHGRSAGILVTMGLCTGLVVHTTLVALGVAAVFKASALAFTILKLTGSCYLLFLAFQAFSASAHDLKQDGASAVDRIRLYRRGIIMNITNPKVSIFFLAFLPQFTDPSKGSLALQMIILGIVFILSTILVFGAIALMAGTIGEWFARSVKARRNLNRLAGTVFLVLAFKLFFAER